MQPIASTLFRTDEQGHVREDPRSAGYLYDQISNCNFTTANHEFESWWYGVQSCTMCAWQFVQSTSGRVRVSYCTTEYTGFSSVSQSPNSHCLGPAARYLTTDLQYIHARCTCGACIMMHRIQYWGTQWGCPASSFADVYGWPH